MITSPATLSPAALLSAYRMGYFPMAHDDGEIHWHDPDPRAIFPLDRVRANARLRSYIRSHAYQCSMDASFEEVMRACAGRESTWITREMIEVYCALHRQGHAHSVETWQKGELIGGIYGISIGAAFFGESMFSRATNASKAAFHHLTEHLRSRSFVLFDSQYINAHTRSLGAVEIPRHSFRSLLGVAVESPDMF